MIDLLLYAAASLIGTVIGQCLWAWSKKRLADQYTDIAPPGWSDEVFEEIGQPHHPWRCRRDTALTPVCNLIGHCPRAVFPSGECRAIQVCTRQGECITEHGPCNGWPRVKDMDDFHARRRAIGVE